jgi:hypothetical protein
MALQKESDYNLTQAANWGLFRILALFFFVPIRPDKIRLGSSIMIGTKAGVDFGIIFLAVRPEIRNEGKNLE